MTDPSTSAAPGVNCTRCGAVMLDLYRCPNCTPGNAAVHPLHMPRPGRCHNAYCDEPTTHVVRYRRIRGGWATGIDYCEPHAHEAAQRMRENFKVVVEPT